MPPGQDISDMLVPPPPTPFLEVLTQGRSCGLERERCYPLVTAEQVILLKPGVCCCSAGWKLPLLGAGADVPVASTGEIPSIRQGANQPN